MLKVNENDPSNANYAILDQMESFRGTDGTFHFKLKWPGDVTEYEWKQTSNPITQTIAGYQGINIPYNRMYWGGLEPSGNALMDGSVGHSNWHFAVGSFRMWKNGIPSYAQFNGDYESTKKSVELYVIKGMDLN